MDIYVLKWHYRVCAIALKWLLSSWKHTVTNHHTTINSHVREMQKKSLIYSVPGLGLRAQLANKNVMILQALI